MPEIHTDPTVRRQRGFTLVEAAVSLFVTVIVLLGVLALFDFSNKLTHAQTNVADMQQSLRVAQADAVRLIRMAGRGGLPLPPPPPVGQPWRVDWALEVRNNVPTDSHIGGDNTPEIVPGSDVLTVRGVFGQVYQINTAAPGVFSFDPATSTGTVQIASTTPTGIPQDLTPLRNAIGDSRPVAILLVSPLNSGVWAVVELVPPSSGSGPNQVVVGFRFGGAYGKFSSAGTGVYPPQLTTASLAGILEEHRFYVRREFAIADDETSDLTPKLTEARVYPGTETPDAGNVTNWRLDIADNVFDLQVALGFSATAGACGALPAEAINCETADGVNDDWVFNGEQNPDPTPFANADLLYVRLNTLARTDRRDRDYTAPLLVRTEDNRYVNSPFNSGVERMYRRRGLRTLIDLRNL